MSRTTLYRKHSTGQIGTWHIWIEAPYLYYSHCSVEGGSESVHRDHIQTNQSGRNLMEQLTLAKDSRIRRALDKGYKWTREEAVAGPTNQLNLPNPMLAQKIQDAGAIDFDSVEADVQPKLDGHRCLITRADGELIAYTRKGKPINTISHILREFEWLEEGPILDGELYVHGPKLQDIGSWIKRDQEDSAKLQFCWYDLMANAPYRTRYHSMKTAYEKHNPTNVVLVDTQPVKSFAEVWDKFRQHRTQGFEGTMLRLSTVGYESNKRSRQLLKVKERHDCEVKVLGAWPARDGSAILHVRMDSGREFDTLAPGSIPEKIEVMEHIENYVGKKLTIEYAHLTSDGIPFHAVATRWHEEL